MSLPLFEILSGTINGVNPTFFFSGAYVPGTVAIYINGQLLLNDSGNPWSESVPATGEITITAAECIPRVGDEIAGFALDANAPDDLIVVEEIVGVVEVIGTLGVLEPANEIAGVIQVQPIVSVLEPAEEFVGVVEVVPIVGVLEVC